MTARRTVSWLRDLVAPAILLLAAGAPASAADFTSRVPGNAFAFIPPQCYTKTRDASGGVHNPCYTCHVSSRRPNYVDDGDLQTMYDFPGPAAENRWSNLFVDRRAAIAATPDEAILTYVRQDNYHDGEAGLRLAERLKDLPASWDINGDGHWSGYTPDIGFDFDADGSDRGPGGGRTGWRAFAYAPLPGAFWPTNGSADDVAIRLPEAFREKADGTTDWAIYDVNLAIVEALAKRADVAIPATDEAALGVDLDLDRDGTLGTAHRVVFAFDPSNGVNMSYVGRAKVELEAGRLHLAAGLFPEGTEFVHTLRYLDVAGDGSVRASPRLKELRYARKTGWMTYWNLREKALGESREEHDYPDRPEQFLGDVETGISTGQGWRFQGFVENAGGSCVLRPTRRA